MTQLQIHHHVISEIPLLTESYKVNLPAQNKTSGQNINSIFARNSKVIQSYNLISYLNKSLAQEGQTNQPSLWEDKATRNRQHNFTTAKLCLTNLTAFSSEMADQKEHWTLHALIFTKAFNKVYHSIQMT